MHHLRSHKVRLFGILIGVQIALSLPHLAGAQTVFDDWQEPVVVELGLMGARNGQRPRRLEQGRIELGPDEQFVLSADPLDQRGRRFPANRFELGLEMDRRCRDRLEVSGGRKGQLSFSAGQSQGRCRVVLFVPGNLNLEYDLEFEVTGIGASNYTRGQAEEIVKRLYLAVLQRPADKDSFATAVTEIQRGRLSQQITSMVRSKAFAGIRDRSQPASLLDVFYEGLLDRTPDSAGINDYLSGIRRGRYADALLNLVQSEEFEMQLPRR
ncbi:MAG: DUF4214 domain-containing protein [Acidobacteriota bacterium]|nr:DUF4214 domain-containing protein [Acidobacteriota bacterium]